MALTHQTAIRLATTRDMHVIADMSRRFVEQGLPWRWKGARVYQHIRHPDSTVIVAEQDDAITGFAIARFSEMSIHINLLAVDDAVRGQGVGASLIEWIRASAAVAGIATINLEVRRTNEGAVAFYKKLGFETVGMHKGYYEGLDDARLMSLRLIDPEQEKLRPAK